MARVRKVVVSHPASHARVFDGVERIGAHGNVRGTGNVDVRHIDKSSMVVVTIRWFSFLLIRIARRENPDL